MCSLLQTLTQAAGRKLGSFCSTIELHPRWVRIIPGYGWLCLKLEIAGDITGMAVQLPYLFKYQTARSESFQNYSVD